MSPAPSCFFFFFFFFFFFLFFVLFFFRGGGGGFLKLSVIDDGRAGSEDIMFRF